MQELSQNDIYSLLSEAIKGGINTVDGPWVRDVYATYFVYSGSGGKLYQRPYSIAPDTRTVTMGDATEVVQSTAYTPVVHAAAFTLSGKATFSDDFVEREGVIFEAGDYEVQGFSMTPDELPAAIEGFEGADLELEHYDTNGVPNILSGKLGRLTGAWVADNGKTLMGKVSLPAWLNKLYDGQGIKVSSTFFREPQKKLAGAGLVLRPQVTNAAVFSALVQFAGARHSAGDMADVQAIHDLTVKQGAMCSPPDDKAAMSAPTQPAQGQQRQQPKQETKKMTFADKVKALWNATPAEEKAGTTPEELALFGLADSPNPTAPLTAPSPEVEALQKQVQAQATQLAQFAADRRTASATQKVDALITARKMYPSERPYALAAFSLAIEDDERDSRLVTFSSADGKEVKASRVGVLEAQYAARTPHNLTNEQVAVFTLPPMDGSKAEDEAKARKEKLLAMTSAGQEVIKSRNGNGAH